MKICTNHFSVNNESPNDLRMFSFFTRMVAEYFSLYCEYTTMPHEIHKKDEHFREKVIPVLKALKNAVEVNIETMKIKRGLYGICISMISRKNNQKQFTFIHHIKSNEIRLVSSHYIEL